MQSTYAAEESIVASSCKVWKGIAECLGPDRRLVPTGQQVSPKAEVEFGHQIVGRQFLPHSFEVRTRLGNVTNLSCFQQPVRIVVPIGSVTLADRPLGHRRMNGVAKDHFHIREYFEQRTGYCRVPFVQPDRSREITITRCEVRREPFEGKPLGQEFRVDPPRWERRLGSRLGVGPT